MTASSLFTKRAAEDEPPLVGEHRFSTVLPAGVDTRPRKVFRYTYGEARASTDGHGSYGFGKRTIQEFDGGVDAWTPGPLFSTTDLTYFNEDFARAGLLRSKTVTSGQLTNAIDGFVRPARRSIEETRIYEKIIHDTTNHPTIVFPALKQSTIKVIDKPEAGSDLVVSTTIEDFTSGAIRTDYDGYGNSMYHFRQVFAGDNAGRLVTSSLTVRSFKPADTGRWLVGLVQNTQVSDTRGGETTTRIIGSEYDDASGRLIQRTRDPGGAFEQIEEFHYDDPVHNLTERILRGGQKHRSVRYLYDDASLIFPVS